MSSIETDIDWIVGIFIWAATISILTACYAVIQHLRNQKEIRDERSQIKSLNEEKNGDSSG